MASRLVRDRRGTFIALAGVSIPVVGLSGIALADIYFVHARKEKFNDTVHAVCVRALKPTRTKLMTDKERENFANQMLRQVLTKNDFDGASFDANVDWVQVHLEAASQINPLTNLFYTSDVPVSTEIDCEGIPSYPQDGETLLSSTFTDEQGDQLYLSKGGGINIANCWDTFDYTEFGWDGAVGTDSRGRTRTGYIEIQNWNTDLNCFQSAYQIPEEVGSNYVIELDSYYNTSIWKQVELHPGKYRVSFWYFGRVNNTETNGISVSLEGVKGSKKPKTKIMEVARPASDGWNFETHEFTITEYQIDNLYLSAEGRSDSIGGLINGFNLTYLDTLNPIGS